MVSAQVAGGQVVNFVLDSQKLVQNGGPGFTTKCAKCAKGKGGKPAWNIREGKIIEGKIIGGKAPVAFAQKIIAEMSGSGRRTWQRRLPIREYFKFGSRRGRKRLWKRGLAAELRFKLVSSWFQVWRGTAWKEGSCALRESLRLRAPPKR